MDELEATVRVVVVAVPAIPVILGAQAEFPKIISAADKYSKGVASQRLFFIENSAIVGILFSEQKIDLSQFTPYYCIETVDNVECV